MDEILDAEITVKATAAQWYWQYSYGDYSTNNEGITFDSFMVAEEDLEIGDFRRLAVDNALVLPINTSIRISGHSVLISSSISYIVIANMMPPKGHPC